MAAVVGCELRCRLWSAYCVCCPRATFTAGWSTPRRASANR